MRTFIFATYEGHIYQPDSVSTEPDVDNMQVFASGGYVTATHTQQIFICSPVVDHSRSGSD